MRRPEPVNDFAELGLRQADIFKKLMEVFIGELLIELPDKVDTFLARYFPAADFLSRVI